MKSWSWIAGTYIPVIKLRYAKLCNWVLVAVDHHVEHYSMKQNPNSSFLKTFPFFHTIQPRQLGIPPRSFQETNRMLTNVDVIWGGNVSIWDEGFEGIWRRESTSASSYSSCVIISYPDSLGVWVDWKERTADCTISSMASFESWAMEVSLFLNLFGERFSDGLGLCLEVGKDGLE